MSRCAGGLGGEGEDAAEVELLDLHAAALGGEGLLRAVRGLIQRGQVVQALGVVGVRLAQGLLPDLQSLAIERLGPGIRAIGIQQARLFRLAA